MQICEAVWVEWSTRIDSFAYLQTFREIHDMACAGDPSKVDQMMGETSKLSADDDIYASLAAAKGNLKAYCLGQVVNTPRGKLIHAVMVLPCTSDANIYID